MIAICLETISMKCACFLHSQSLSLPFTRSFHEKLFATLESAIHQGYHHYFCGFDEEADCIFAQLVLSLKQKYSYILLEAYLPYYEERLFSSPIYRELIAQCDQITFTTASPDKNSRQRRDLNMLRRCGLAIVALEDGDGQNVSLKQALLDKSRFLELL